MALSLFSSDSKSRTWPRWLVVAVLVAIITAVALPQYVSGQLSWQSPPGVPQIRAIRELKETGLFIEGWSQDFQQKIPIGGSQWSVQQLTHASDSTPQQMVLFLKPQGQADDQPEVEWIDIKGSQKWQTSDQRRLRTGMLNIDTFRAWTSTQTFAVAQWYALPEGGHPAPYHWFWRDQKYQWSRRERLPWVAVSMLVPMPPLGDVSLFYSDLENLSQQVQKSLENTVFLDES
ncbi:MAG: cyanoexosortase B system-associated protein [Leptolyngbyaceae cyanobacterium]